MVMCISKLNENYLFKYFYCKHSIVKLSGVLSYYHKGTFITFTKKGFFMEGISCILIKILAVSIDSLSFLHIFL